MGQRKDIKSRFEIYYKPKGQCSWKEEIFLSGPSLGTVLSDNTLLLHVSSRPRYKGSYFTFSTCNFFSIKGILKQAFLKGRIYISVYPKLSIGHRNKYLLNKVAIIV